VVGSDVVSLSTTPTTGLFADANVAYNGAGAVIGKTVTISGLGLTGSSSSNYTIGPSTTTASITPLVLQLTGVKSYDGSTTVSAASIAAGNAVAGDTVTFNGSATIASAAVGTQRSPA